MVDDDDDAHDPVADADAMAEELEREPELELDAEAVDPARRLPMSASIPAAMLSAAIALPLHPEGFSFARLLLEAFARSPVEGVFMLLGFGSPFCFGFIVLALALAGPRVLPRIGERILIANLSLLHAQLFLVAMLLSARGQGMMPLALLGFACVSGGYFIVHHARTAATGGVLDERGLSVPSGPALRWLVRWGATVIVAVCGWVRLQLLVDVRLGWAIEMMLAACVMLTVLLVRRAPRRL